MGDLSPIKPPPSKIARARAAIARCEAALKRAQRKLAAAQRKGRLDLVARREYQIDRLEKRRRRNAAILQSAVRYSVAESDKEERRRIRKARELVELRTMPNPEDPRIKPRRRSRRHHADAEPARELTAEERALLHKKIEEQRLLDMHAARERRQKLLSGKWTSEIVSDRMIEAFEVLLRLPLPTHPKQYGNAMLPYLYDEADRQGWQELRAARDSDLNRVKLAATAAEVQRMEAAFEWPMRYIADDETKRITSLWALWRAKRLSITKQCRRRGIHLSTFKRKRNVGLASIAYGLSVDRVPIELRSF